MEFLYPLGLINYEFLPIFYKLTYSLFSLRQRSKIPDFMEILYSLEKEEVFRYYDKY